MQIDPEQVEPTTVYSTMIRAITPRPIAWVSTVSPNGIPNLAPFSYFNGICSKPAALMFSAVNHPDGSHKDTVVNILATRQFVVNVVPHGLARQMGLTAESLEYEASEFQHADLETAPSQHIAPPCVAASPIHFECELLQHVPVGEGPLAANVMIGKILWINIADNILDERGKIDSGKLDTVGRMGGRSYCTTREQFELG